MEEDAAIGIDVRGTGYVRRPGVECEGGIYRPVSDDSTTPEGLSHWWDSGEADAGHYDWPIALVAGAPVMPAIAIAVLMDLEEGYLRCPP